MQGRRHAHFLVVRRNGKHNTWVGIRHQRVRWLLVFRGGLSATTAAHLIRHVT